MGYFKLPVWDHLLQEQQETRPAGKVCTPEEGAWCTGAQSAQAKNLSPTYQLGTEFRQHHTGGSHPEWTEQLVDHAVDMVQWEDVEDHIVFSPRPLVHQPRHLQDNSTASDRREATMLSGLPS